MPQVEAIQFDAQGRPFTMNGGRISYMTPTDAGTSALLFAEPGPARDALLAERGITPDISAKLIAYAQQHGVTAQNPFPTDRPNMNGFASRYQWDPATGTYKRSMGAGLSGLIQGGAALAAPMFVGPMLAGTPTILGGAGAASGASGGVLPSTSTGAAMSTTPMYPIVEGSGAAAAGAGSAAGSAATSGGIINQLTKAMKNPRNIAGLAALLPMFAGMRGGGGSPFDAAGVNEEITKSLAMQRGRMEQAQPAYDTLVNMAYGMSPTRYRGGTAPSGYTPNAPAKDAYQYQAPRFG